MGIRLIYQESPYFKVNSLEIVGDMQITGRMLKANHEWVYNCMLPEGKYRYKFLFNGSMLLNDPLASAYEIDEKNEIWSVLIINNNGNKLNMQNHDVMLIDFYLCTAVNEVNRLFSKKIFDTSRLDKVIAKFEFGEVMERHCITAAWYDPYGDLYEYSDNQLKNGEKRTNLWFWMNLLPDMMEGNWTVKLFIDGQFLAQEKFEICHFESTTYKGNVNILL